MTEWIGLLGLCGLFGLIGLKHKIPADVPGSSVRLGGLLGFVGLAGFWIPALGACGAFGALSLWNHPQPRFARLAWCGLFGLIGIVLYLQQWK